MRRNCGSGDTTAFEAKAVTYYLAQLRRRFQYAKPFKVCYWNPVEQLKAAPVCFHLLFASHQEQGLFEMNDAMAVAHKPSFTITDVKRQGMQTDYLLMRGGEYRKLVIEMSKGELEKLDPGPAKNDSTRYRVKKAR